ncbi:DUF3093 family protein [Glutamicibacter arilaitensis]|uniref:DUF3093 family protein n=1 Tax=Glutamicibacter arilaitensis TaxID=256701 RepID=A0A4Y8TYA6_9MICC|nr:DUF3093 family protein [Glutamicibacter arilaitensis]TFH56504.1 DUF3093 family protein [Glutamicibacter arilaitensis]
MATPNTEIKNKTLVILLVILPAAIVAICYALLSGKLPEMTATHWGSTSTYPDGFTRTAVFVPVCIGLSILGAAVGLVSLRLRNNLGLLVGLLFAGGVLSWTTAGVFVGSAVPTALAESAETAVIGGMMIVMIVCSLMGLVPLWISGIYQQYAKDFNAQRQARIDQAQGFSRQPVVQEEAMVQQEFKQSMAAPWWMWLLCLVVPGVLVVAVLLPMVTGESQDTGIASQIITGVLCLLVCVLMLSLVWIRVSIKKDRFRVSSAVLGFPMRTIDVADIESVTSEKIVPMMWGGWGWRIIPGGSAIVMKEHEGLVFELKNRKRFAVTIPESQQAAQLLNARLARTAH